MTDRKQQSETQPEPDSEKDELYFSRRKMMAGAGSLTAGAVIGINLVEKGEAQSGENETRANESQSQNSGNQSQEVPRADDVGDDAFQFFDIGEAQIVDALAERIYPSDDLGPGAPEAGVVFFIDRQLNGSWGEGGKHYMEEPFYPDMSGPALGWQYDLVPSEVYEYSLEFLQEHLDNEYDTSSINELDTDQQDDIVTALETDEIDTFRGIDPSDFFAMLRQGVLEGMFADPVYGGNQNMVGWKLKQFPGTPGALGSYRGSIQDEEFHEIPPTSLEYSVESVSDFGDGQEG